jgi:hypothetical protein
MSYSNIDKKRAYNKKYYREYYKAHKVDYLLRGIEYYKKNHDKILKYSREYGKKWRKKRTKYFRNWRHNNYEKIRKHRNKWIKKIIKELGDSYIKMLLCDRESILKGSDFPQPLIEVKRQEIKLRRKLNELRCKMVERRTG